MPEETPTTEETNLNNAVAYVKAVLWINWQSEDSLLEILVKSAVAKIKSLTQIDLLSLWTITDYFDWAWQRELFLKIWPAWTITKIEINQNQWWTPDWKEKDPATYILKDDFEVVFSWWLPRGFKNVKITYQPKFADFNSISRDYENLKTALALIVWNLRVNRKQSWISSESVSWTSIVYDKNVLTNDIQTLINPYIIFAI